VLARYIKHSVPTRRGAMDGCGELFISGCVRILYTWNLGYWGARLPISVGQMSKHAKTLLWAVRTLSTLTLSPQTLIVFVVVKRFKFPKCIEMF
jgi:hypothetical protein